MTPKSLLRHPKVISSQNDFVNGKFREVIDDAAIRNPAAVKRIVFCSCKAYYDLLTEQVLHPNNAIAIVRLEQFYPFTSDQVDALLKKYYHAKEIVWTQEGPKNMGAWTFIQPYYYRVVAEWSASHLRWTQSERCDGNRFVEGASG